MKRLVALTPPPNRHLTSFHGVYAPNAKLRPLVVTAKTPATPAAPPPSKPSTPPRTPSPRLDWATLHQRTPVKAAEARLVE
ncbi:MAG: hypothetical protein AMXMBFR34_07600 [Myxococcaceae bacterium]